MAINQTFSRVLWIVTGILTLIGIGIVVRRILIIGDILPTGGGRGPDFDSDFHVPLLMTLLHILPGLVFVIFGPLQFLKRLRNRYSNIHRYCGWTFITAAYIIGFSSLLMPFISMPIGGISEAVASVLFSSFFLWSVTQALRYILMKKITLHREWMLRTFAIGMAIVTVRLIMALTFVVFGLTPEKFLSTAFWMGFTIHLITAEVWINHTRQVKNP